MKLLKRIHFDEKLLLVLLFVFVFINWLILSSAEKIAPPDFYKIYFVAQRLFSGDLKTRQSLIIAPEMLLNSEMSSIASRSILIFFFIMKYSTCF